MIPGFPKVPSDEDDVTAGEALLATQENRPVLSVTRAARLLGKSTDTIYRWLNAGRLSARKVGGRWLIYRDSVEKQWSAEIVEPQDE
jgi:excisionase family DNA binding protein